MMIKNSTVQLKLKQNSALKAFMTHRIHTRRSRQNSKLCVKNYSLLLETPEGKIYNVECSEDEFMLDAAQNQGVPLPYCCKQGICTSCLARVSSGEVVQGRAGARVSRSLQERGYVLMCSFKPSSDCVISTHRNSDLNQVEYAYQTSIDFESFDEKLQELGL